MKKLLAASVLLGLGILLVLSGVALYKFRQPVSGPLRAHRANAPSPKWGPSETFVIGTPPYHSNKVEQVIGIVRKAYQTFDYDVSIQILPGERCLLAADSGNIDGDLHRIDGINNTYTHLRKVNIPIALNFHHAFVKNATISVNGYASLRPFRIGFTRGFKAIERGTANGFSVVKVTDDEAAFRMLDSGRVDVVITDLDEGLSLVKSLGLTGIRALEPPVETIELFHYVNERHSALVPLLENALRGTPPVR